MILEFLTLFIIVYCVYTSAEEGGGVSTTILVPVSSDGCQSSNGGERVGA